MYIFINFLKKVGVFFAVLLLLNVFIYNNLVFNLVLVVTALCLTDFVFNVVWHLMPKEMVPNLSDKAVFITGCDSGFGHQLAKHLEKLGIMVFAGCLFPDGEGASQLKNSCSEKLKIIQLDVTKEDHVEKSLEIVTSTLQERNEMLWAVVNNAGIPSGSEVEWTSMDDFHQVIDINALGVVRVTRAFLPLLRKSKGRVVIVTSALGRISISGLSAYCMSKYAAVALADTLRRELMRCSVSVHTIQPWFYRTNITDTKMIDRTVARNWEKTPQNVREFYGEGYPAKYKMIGTKLLSIVSRPESAVHEVVDSLVHATVGKNPKVCYVPGIVGLMQTKFYSALSDELYDMISNTIYEKLFNKCS
ncbi:short-chain dehydrogenase/reductase family 9C member 7-like [Periplaneta americana]|uniref:short-chain dehydrogenase/reductase family 9C member 7-like n=1 Tax=Periplaneta americana TaxID=6978 RepID=UPI0037E8F275